MLLLLLLLGGVPVLGSLGAVGCMVGRGGYSPQWGVPVGTGWTVRLLLWMCVLLWLLLWLLLLL